MTGEQWRRTGRLAAAIALISMGAACAHGGAKTVDPGMRGSQAIASQIQGGGRASVPIPNHLIPSRDSVGSSPARFEWSAVPGADSYSIGVWNEVDMMIWRVDHVQGTSVDTGTQKFDPGTYFWTISAVKDGEEISASGLAAFVVRPNTP